MGKNSKKHLKIVSFDEEIVTKNNADKLLSTSEQIDIKCNDTQADNEINADINSSNKSDPNREASALKSKKKKKNKLNESSENIETINQEVQLNKKRKKKKGKKETNNEQNIYDNENVEQTEGGKVKRKKKEHTTEDVQVDVEATDEISVENPKVKTTESIRAQKRKKHAKLLEEKRTKVDVATQQNALNYLSKWKHCRNEWKFEKLKQIWLQQNLFDASKIPAEFWETVVEYFGGSKGFIRNVVLRDALKIIEKEENVQDEESDENTLLVLDRARDIVQNLQ